VIRLAVVEDEALTREVTVERLTARFGCEAAVDGFVSVEQMLATGVGFDVVVLDLQLRGGGVENADGVRAVAQVSRVVVFSGKETAESLQRARDAGALAFVGKETSDAAAMLVTAIRHALRGEPFLDPDLAARIGASARRQLTPRQQEVLRLEALGRTTQQIARVLDLSAAGVRRHIERIVETHPDCAKQADRVRLAVELGLVSPWENYRPPAGREP
jgi:DNA-binding NarL/FixJ family response regulator